MPRENKEALKEDKVGKTDKSIKKNERVARPNQQKV